MPFGEELNAGIGSRTGENGLKYASAADPVRQKFTGYQKDSETSLDFAEARMYANEFGRFTAIDPLLASGKSANPQTFNRFVYSGNRPLIVTDPLGLSWYQRDVNGRTFYQWSSDDKNFDDGSSVDGWDQVDFGHFSREFFYYGCVDAECSATKGAVLYKEGSWDWVTSLAYTWRSLKEEQVKDWSAAFTYYKKEVSSGFPDTRLDINDIIQDPLGEKGLGNPGLSFVTDGISQEATLLKGLRTVATESEVTTEVARDSVLYEQYSLRATRDGMYPVMQRGFKEPVGEVFLKQGEIWKFGQTTRGAGRYSASWLEDTGLLFKPEFKTPTFKDVLQIERQKIVEYEVIFGKLPPGNKIRR